MKEGSAEVQILPAFKRTDAISVRGHGRIMFEVWEVNGDVDRIKAIQLISRSHYLSAPVSGLILGCRFVNADEQQQVLSQAKVSERPDPWSEAWYEKSGGMVACAMIGTLYHGNPRGRKHIAEEEKIANLTKGQWHKKNRKEIISQLGVLWASRFAVDAPYRGLGLGSLLAARLVNVCLKHHVPQARYIEVVTTLPTDKAKALLKEESKERDFLVSAGYTRVPELLPSRRQLRADPETGERVEFVSAKKLYYYKKVE
jgi:GNAT superfamily N-acetyltransferase